MGIPSRVMHAFGNAGGRSCGCSCAVPAHVSRRRAMQSGRARILSEDLFFEHPWRDPELTSRVSLAGDGTVNGFVGVLPARMTYRGTRCARPSRARDGRQPQHDPLAARVCCVPSSPDRRICRWAKHRARWCSACGSASVAAPFRPTAWSGSEFLRPPSSASRCSRPLGEWRAGSVQSDLRPIPCCAWQTASLSGRVARCPD